MGGYDPFAEIERSLKNPHDDLSFGGYEYIPKCLENEARSCRHRLNVKPRWLNGNTDILVDGYINIVICNWCSLMNCMSVRGFAAILSVSKIQIMICDGQSVYGHGGEEAQKETAGKQGPYCIFSQFWSNVSSMTGCHSKENFRVLHITYNLSWTGVQDSTSATLMSIPDNCSSGPSLDNIQPACPANVNPSAIPATAVTGPAEDRAANTTVSALMEPFQLKDFNY